MMTHFTFLRLLLAVATLLMAPLSLAATNSYAVKVLVATPSSSSNLLLQFNQAIRWEQVLSELAARDINPNWGQLTKPSELAALEAERTQVLKDLHLLGQRWARQGKQDLLNSSVALAQQVRELSLVARQPVTMSYDLVRLKPRLNPLLQGDYVLTVSPRPTVVWAQGLVRVPGKRPFVAGGYAYDYARRLPLLKGGDAHQIWIIQPDGHILSSSVDAFAPEFVGVAPGATLFVGFAKLPKDFADLNQRIMTLFANREI